MSFSKIHKICCACVHIMSCIPFSADILCSTREIRGGGEREGRILASALWPQAQYRFEGNSLLLSFFADLSATLFSGLYYLVFQNVLDLKCAAVYMHSDLAQNFSKQRGNEGAVCTKNNLASHTHFPSVKTYRYNITIHMFCWSDGCIRVHLTVTPANTRRKVNVHVSLWFTHFPMHPCRSHLPNPAPCLASLWH